MSPAACTVVEGSGLDRANRMTPRAMHRILEAFAPHRRLLPTRGADLVKSGTLNGVSNYAGYLDCRQAWYPFVIFIDHTDRRQGRHPPIPVPSAAGPPRYGDRDSWLTWLHRRCRSWAAGKRAP